MKNKDSIIKIPPVPVEDDALNGVSGGIDVGDITRTVGNVGALMVEMQADSLERVLPVGAIAEG